MGANDVAEQLDAAIADVIRLERELLAAKTDGAVILDSLFRVIGERDRARRTAARLEQEVARSESIRSDLRSVLAETALEWHQRGVAVEALSLGVAENAARRRKALERIEMWELRDGASGPWHDDEVNEILDDIVKLLNGQIL